MNKSADSNLYVGDVVIEIVIRSCKEEESEEEVKQQEQRMVCKNKKGFNL